MKLIPIFEKSNYRLPLKKRTADRFATASNYGKHKADADSWNNMLANDDGEALLDPILQKRVINQTRSIIANIFSERVAEYQSDIEIVNLSDNRYDAPCYNFKVVCDLYLGGDVEDYDEMQLEKVAQVMTKKMQTALNSEEFSTAEVEILTEDDAYVVRITYVGPNRYDSAGMPFKTRNDYFNGVMPPIESDLKTIYGIYKKIKPELMRY